MEADGLDGVCAGLGCISPDPSLCYVKSEHCLENLKSLQRFLRRDHPTSRPVFKQLGKWNTVGRDLVPIITQYCDDLQLVINAVKVVVFLTMPVDPLSENVSQQLEYMLDFKASFLHNEAIAAIMTLLEEPLEHLESNTFSEDDWKVVQLVLTLMRNLLDIQDMSHQKFSVAETTRVLSIRDKLLEHLFEENVMDLILALAQHISGPAELLRQDSVLFLEIFHHIFWGQSPEKIVKANALKSQDNSPKQPAGLLRVMTEEEHEQLKDLRLKDLSRHSRFSGSFVRLAEDGSRKMLKRNPFQSSIDAVIRGPQVKHGPVKRVAYDRSSSTSDGRVLELLKTFADQVLLGSYNVVMQTMKDDISRERNWIQTADVTLFFEVAKFFTAYQRCNLMASKLESRKKRTVPVDAADNDCLFQGQLCGPIASTMDEDMFAMVVSRWHAYSEAVKETNDWISLSVTGALFKEMVRMLDLVLKDSKSHSDNEHQEARVTRILLYKVFYDQTEKGTFQFLLHLLKSFDIHKQPRSHLADLIETVHVVLRLIEFLTEEDGALRVLKKSRKSNKRKSKSKDLEQGQNHPDNVTIGMANDVNIDAEKNHLPHDCNANILLANPATSNGSVSIEGVNKESPDSAIPSDGMTATEYLCTLKPIEELDTHLGDNDRDASKHSPSLSEKHIHDVPEQDKDPEYDSEQENAKQNVEVSLNVQRCASMFADNTVLYNYCWLLRFFSTNRSAINHYILCMLQRICKGFILEPMLFQLSLLQIFYEILSDKKASKLEEHQKLFTFLTKLMRNFFKKLKAQPLLFLDVLFWKSRSECHLITTDYKIQSLRKSTGKSVKKGSIADALGNDEADGDPCFRCMDQSEHGGLETNLESPSTTKKSDQRRKNKRRKKAGPFTEEQETQLIKLFELHKGNPKFCQLLAQEIDPEGKITAAHVRRRLKAMNMSPTLKRCRINKQVEGQNGSADPKKKKRRKMSNQKHNEEVHEKTGTDIESSDDMTLTQLMEKVRTQNSQQGSGNGSGSKKRSKTPTAEHCKETRSEEDDETVQDYLAKRKRACRRGEAVPQNLDTISSGDQQHKWSNEQENSKSQPHNRMERKFVEEALMDESLEDDMDPEDATGISGDQSLEDDLEELMSGRTMTSLSPRLASLLGSSASVGGRRRNLFTVDDDEM